MIELVVPELGAAAGDIVTVSSWLVSVGDEVVEGDRVVELLVGEMTFDVSSPTSGRVVEIVAEIDETVTPSALLAWIEPEVDEA